MMSRWIMAFSAMTIFASQPALAERSTEKYTSLTVFGDSLVDSGNFYIMSGKTTPDPAQGYFQNRFTNGYDYTDLISLSLFGTPTTPSLAGGNNFGVAGARVVDVGDGIPDLQAQIGMWQATGVGVDPNGLYVLNFGANDVFAAKGVFDAAGGIGAYADTSSYLKAAADQYVAGVQALNDLGVRNILMTDFPLGIDPFTVEANGYLAAALSGLTLSAGSDLFVYSLADLNVRLVTDPASIGLGPQNYITSCIDAGAQATNCVGYASFDGVHPTAAIQEIGFHEMDQRFGLTSSVPEPATWAMMIAGFGAIGFAMRHGRRSMKIAYA